MADISTQEDKQTETEKKGVRQGSLIVISGPSGVGKGTCVERLINQVPGLSRSVSVTTRARRAEEKEGVDYWFRSFEEFDAMRAKDEFLEWAEFTGNNYGTPRHWVFGEIMAGQDVILEIEVMGAKQVRERCPQAVLIFLSPPSFQALEARLTGRATENSEKIRQRLAKAREEIAQKHLFNYEVVNDNIEATVDNLVHIIYAERLRIRTSFHEPG